MDRRYYVDRGFLAVGRFARLLGAVCIRYPLKALAWLVFSPFIVLGFLFEMSGAELEPSEECFIEGHDKDHQWGPAGDWRCERCGEKHHSSVRY